MTILNRLVQKLQLSSTRDIQRAIWIALAALAGSPPRTKMVVAALVVVPYRDKVATTNGLFTEQ